MKDTVKVGLFTVVAIAALMFGMLWKGGLFVKVRSYNIYGEFDTVSSLLPNAQVKYRGFNIGNVNRIVPANKGITVEITVKKGIKLPLYSKLRVSFDGLIGEKYIDVIPTVPTDKILPAGSILPGYASKGLVDFVDLGSRNLEELQDIIASLGKILTDPDVNTSIKDSLIHLGDIANEVNGIAKNINNITSSEEIIRLVRSFEKTANSLNFAINSIFQGENEEIFKNGVSDFGEVIKNLKDISYDIDRMTSVMADFIEDEETTQNVKELLVNTNRSLDGLARLMSREDIKDTISETNEALGQTNEILSSLRTIKLAPSAEIFYKHKLDRALFDVGFDLDMFKKYRLDVGYSNRERSDLELDRFALGFYLGKSWIGEFGRFRKNYGLGAGYSFTDNLKVKGNTTFYDGIADSALYLNYGFFNKLYFLMGIESLSLDEERYVLGIGF